MTKRNTWTGSIIWFFGSVQRGAKALAGLILTRCNWMNAVRFLFLIRRFDIFYLNTNFELFPVRDVWSYSSTGLYSKIHLCDSFFDLQQDWRAFMKRVIVDPVQTLVNWSDNSCAKWLEKQRLTALLVYILFRSTPRRSWRSRAAREDL